MKTPLNVPLFHSAGRRVWFKNPAIAIYGGIFVLMLISQVAMAQGTPPPPKCDPSVSPICTANDVVNFFNNLAFWIANIFWIIAVISAFYAGYLYIFKGGVDDVSKAHRQLFYTIIAVAVGLMAYGIPALVSNFLQGK